MATDTESVFDGVVKSIESAGVYNRDDKIAPAAVLWVDPERSWAHVVARFRAKLNLLVLGDYDPEQATGPGIWIRHRLADMATAINNQPAVIYLPGVKRHDLRAIETSPTHLQPLAELQFRSVWWLQSNQTPWTPASFLRSHDGLGMDVGRGQQVGRALGAALDRVLDLPLRTLVAKGRLDEAFFSSLLVSDIVKTLLRWINSPEETRQALSGSEWDAFSTQCRSQLGADVEKDGVLTVTQQLATREGRWADVWSRYAENPHTFPHISDRLRQAKPVAATLFDTGPLSYPQDNDHAEELLRVALEPLQSGTVAVARLKIAELEMEHSSRRQEVWATLGEAPLAQALGHLANVAIRTESIPDHRSLAGFIAWYASEGYEVDRSVLDALALAPETTSRDAVVSAVRAVYLPWADESARRFQDLLDAEPSGRLNGLDLHDGDCVVFVDGLRYDLAATLRARLAAQGEDASLASRLAAVPTVTSTGKAAVAPLAGTPTTGSDFTPALPGGAFSAVTLRRQLESDGVQVLSSDRTAEVAGRGWVELADLDKTGHKLGLKLADRIPQELSVLANDIQNLLDAGWQRVHVVTDHGWLLMPGGLPKVELPEHLTEVRKPRCGRLHAGAPSDPGQPVYPWTWDPDVRIAVPRGIAAFESGLVYAHGGVSPQESITPHLVVSRSASVGGAKLEGVKWIGQRCRIDFSYAPHGAVVEVRQAPGDPSSAVAPGKPVEGSDEASVLVADDTLTGQTAYVVMLSASGEIIAQLPTTIGN